MNYDWLWEYVRRGGIGRGSRAFWLEHAQCVAPFFVELPVDPVHELGHFGIDSVRNARLNKKQNKMVFDDRVFRKNLCCFTIH